MPIFACVERRPRLTTVVGAHDGIDHQSLRRTGQVPLGTSLRFGVCVRAACTGLHGADGAGECAVDWRRSAGSRRGDIHRAATAATATATATTRPSEAPAAEGDRASEDSAAAAGHAAAGHLG